MRALFVHDPRDLEAAIPGGVQLCSREFLEIVRSAADAVELLPVRVTRHPWWRLRRALGLGSYLYYRPAELRPHLRERAGKPPPSHVFLNRTELLRLAPEIRRAWPAARLIVMSHGNQTGDDLYEVAGPEGRRSRGWTRLRSSAAIGFDLVFESQQRHRHVDAVCVMSQEEGLLERWLGTKQLFWIPRLIQSAPVEWNPVAGRVGFVGTLNHTPNLVALREICRRITVTAPPHPEFRVVGGPEEYGRQLAADFPCVTYVGRLDDAALRAEVASWSLFLNPIFWLSRGASMKLGQALGWGLPTLTTISGTRGYQLPSDLVAEVEDSPATFTERLLALSHDAPALRSLRTRLCAPDTAWPNAAEIGRRLREVLT